MYSNMFNSLEQANGTFPHASTVMLTLVRDKVKPPAKFFFEG